MRLNGKYYQVNGTKRGPAPAHDIGIWVGALKPRILKLTGRVADGWLPSLPYLPGGPADLEEMNKHIDEGAASVGRDPSAVRRLLNISGRFARSGRSLLVGPPQQWAEELAGLTLEYGITGFILMADDAPSIKLFAAEIAPATRELVAAERATPGNGRRSKMYSASDQGLKIRSRADRRQTSPRTPRPMEGLGLAGGCSGVNP